MDTIGERIQFVRKNKRLTQTQLADAVGVARSTIALWEADGTRPTIERFKRIAAATDSDVVFLLGENRGINVVHREIGDDELAELMEARLARVEERLAIRPPEKNPKRVDRRDELAIYRIEKHGKGVQVPKWLLLACGSGCDLERTDDLIYFSGIRNSNGLHSAVARGDSMCDTIIPGDVLVLEEFTGGPILLEPIGDDAKNSYRKLHARVPDESICVVSINEDAPTLKRIKYDFSQGMSDWKLMILADNVFEWAPRPVGKNERVTFHAKLIGIAENIQKPAKKHS